MKRPPLPQASSPSRSGVLGEDLAAAHLKKIGYEIVERNYRCPAGEMDIVARDGPVLVFVEVKARRSDAFGEPEESVDERKQRRLSRVALHYLQRKGTHDKAVRFDVVSVRMGPAGIRIEIFRDAFDACW
jgi:putative endonuclease